MERKINVVKVKEGHYSIKLDDFFDDYFVSKVWDEITPIIFEKSKMLRRVNFVYIHKNWR